MNERSQRSARRWLRGTVDTVWRWLWRSVALVLILAAVLLTVARLLLPFAGEYHSELEQRVGSYLGTPVSIGQIDIGWHGLMPRIRLLDLSIERVGPNNESIQFDQAFLTVYPDWHGDAPTLGVADLALVGLELAVTLDDQGRLNALGTTLDPAIFGSSRGAAGEAENAVTQAEGTAQLGALAGVFAVSRLQLLDTRIAITAANGAVHRLQGIELRIANAGRVHGLSLEATLPPQWGGELRAVLEFEGDPADYRHWQARLFLDGKSLALEAWSALLSLPPVHAERGRLDLQLWSDWRDGRLIDAQAEMDLRAVVLAARQGAASARFDQVSGLLHLWRPAPDQWQLDVGQMRVRRDGREWAGDSLSMAGDDAGGLRLAAGGLWLDDLVALARLVPTPSTLAERIVQSAPRGEVRDLRLALARDGGFRLQAGFRDLGWSSSGDIPGMTGLDGSAHLDAAGGRVTLGSRDVRFDAPDLFRQPLHLPELDAQIKVRKDAGTLVLDAPQIRLISGDLKGRGRARIELVEGRAPALDLQFTYRDGVAGAASKYLPVGIMEAPVVRWLDRAFHGGRVTRGSFIMRGRADDFPFRSHDGVFDVDFDVTGGTLHYGDGWPPIGGLQGRVHFSGASLEIQAQKGSARGVQLRRGVARFADLKQGLLQVDVDAQGPVAGMLGVLNDSPLAPRFEPVFAGARADGAAQLELDLAIPVKDVGRTGVRGEVRFAGAGLAQPRYDLHFEQVEGAVRFTERSVTISDLSARLRGRPIRVKAQTRAGVAVFRCNGRFSLPELLPGATVGPLRATAGRSAWEIVLHLPLAAGADSRLEARSSLRGTRVDLPSPLDKPADSARPLRLEVPLAAGRVRTAQLQYGVDTSIALEFEQSGQLDVRRLGAGFGQPAELPQGPGIRVAGSLDLLPLDDWIGTLSAGATQAAPLPLMEVDLQVGEVVYDSYRMSRVRLDGRLAGADEWQLDVSSNEARGTLVWPRGSVRRNALLARFQWVDLALLRRPGTESTSATGAFAGPDALPPLDLRIDRLKFTDATVRDVALVTSSSGAQRNIHRLDFRTEHLEVTGQGVWRAQPSPGTQLRLKVRSRDFGKGLADFGYPGTLGNGEGRVTLDLHWSAPPWQPDLATLGGHVELDLEDGILHDVNPGAARLLGMFSFKAVPFRTLLQKGLIFHRMRGRIDLTDGNAYTNGFKIDSAIGLIRVSGRTGLARRDYDQNIVIEPELSSSLPVIGFLSGGPVTGVAIALLQGIMRNLGQDVDQVTSVEYTVTGSWDNPKVERKDVKQAESGDGSAQPEPRR